LPETDEKSFLVDWRICFFCKLRNDLLAEERLMQLLGGSS